MTPELEVHRAFMTLLMRLTVHTAVFYGVAYRLAGIYGTKDRFHLRIKSKSLFSHVPMLLVSGGFGLLILDLDAFGEAPGPRPPGT